MQYALLIYEGEAEFQARTDPERAGPYWSGWMAYSQALNESGIVRGGAPLEPPGTATTVGREGGQRKVEDGPYADTKEQLGGFWVIEAPDLDAALDWAARAPVAASGRVEVRPVLQRSMPG